MIFTAVIILIALALLVLRDVGRWMGRRLELWLVRDDAQVAGHSFDAHAVQPRLEAVRRDPVAAVHERPAGREYHEELFAAALTTVRRLTFFRERTPRAADSTALIPPPSRR